MYYTLHRTNRGCVQTSIYVSEQLRIALYSSSSGRRAGQPSQINGGVTVSFFLLIFPDSLVSPLAGCRINMQWQLITKQKHYLRLRRFCSCIPLVRICPPDVLLPRTSRISSLPDFGGFSEGDFSRVPRLISDKAWLHAFLISALLCFRPCSKRVKAGFFILPCIFLRP